MRKIHSEQTVCQPDMKNHNYYKSILPFYKRMCDACSDLGDIIAQNQE